MEFSTSISTRFGTFHLACNQDGLTRIILPGKVFLKTGKDVNNAPDLVIKATVQIQEYCEGKRTIFDLPLSPQGTEFQLQVWRIISSIPYGKTLSYGEIAARLGNRKKARAVGGAANANPIPLVIPCHRVIGADGSLTGFAGGLKLKDQLLRFEQDNNSRT